MKWYKVRIDSPIAAELMAMAGASGILEEPEVCGFFDDSRIEEAKSYLANFNPTIEEIENKLEPFHLPPLEIGKFRITPIQSFKLASSDNEILIIPGMGFGTGHHETTRDVIYLMQQIDDEIKTVLDFGTGSGILSIVASKLFKPSKLVALDNDEEALKNAEENPSMNNVEAITTTNFPDDNYDLILANVYAEVLIDLKLFRGKWCLLSGILKEKADVVLDVYTSRYNLVKRMDSGQWTTFLLRA
jgi:ribosomal protein L11 methyltransferase